MLKILMMSLALLVSAPILAQDWPTKTVRIIVPFPPGGSADPIGRAIASKLEASLNQPFIVENRPGASGSIGTAQLARSAPDGHSWVIVFDTHAVNPFLISKMPYKNEDLQPVMVVGIAPLVVATRPDKPYKSLADVVSAAKSNAGGVNFGSVQNGSTGHLQMFLWQEAAGVKLIHVPFRGAGPMITDLLGGHIEFGIGSAAVMMPRINAGALRGIAVTSNKRAPGMPNIPTFKEAGFDGMEAYAWWGIYAPAGVPRPILDKFHAETVKALTSPEIKRQLEEQLGMQLVLNKPEEMAKFVDGEMAKWGKIVKKHNIQMD